MIEIREITPTREELLARRERLIETAITKIFKTNSLLKSLVIATSQVADEGKIVYIGKNKTNHEYSIHDIVNVLEDVMSILPTKEAENLS